MGPNETEPLCLERFLDISLFVSLYLVKLALSVSRVGRLRGEVTRRRLRAAAPRSALPPRAAATFCPLPTALRQAARPGTCAAFPRPRGCALLRAGTAPAPAATRLPGDPRAVPHAFWDHSTGVCLVRCGQIRVAGRRTLRDIGAGRGGAARSSFGSGSLSGEPCGPQRETGPLHQPFPGKLTRSPVSSCAGLFCTLWLIHCT